jgi:FkbH-like protein
VRSNHGQLASLGWLSELPPEDQLRILGKLLDAADKRGHGSAADTCDPLFEALSGIAPDRLDAWLEARPASATTRYLQARAAAAAGNADTAARRWEELLALDARRDPVVLLQSGRALAAAGNLDAAAARLREALSLRPPYSFYARGAGFVDDTWNARPPALRRARVAVLGASTTSFFVPVLRALCFRDGVNAEFYEAPYGAYRQDILDPASGLYRFKPTVALILTHWRELALPPLLEREADEVARVTSEYESLWKTLSSATGCHIVQAAFDLPVEESHDYVAAARPGGRSRVIELINLELAQRAPSFVSVLDAPATQAEVGRLRWQDPALWHMARQHPSTDALPALAEAAMAHLRAVTGLTRKVIVCDLDNTLWGGVIGEDGLSGIQVGPGSPKGEAYARLQDYLLELKARGVLLTVCSKNNLEDARLPFERHAGMRLHLDDFVAFVANWQDKAQNLSDIARLLSVGTDSLVFVDDSPFERAWVRSQMPEVAVVELGTSPFTFPVDLDRGRHFFSLALTAEDRERSSLYKSEAARQTLLTSTASLEEFLKQLSMRASAHPVTPDNLARVAQLVTKTNQFNLTGRRRQPGEIEALSQDCAGWAQVFSLTDRFGAHGLIGVMLCMAADRAAWEIDTWVMSCRVLGRQVERFMFDRLVEAASLTGIERLVGVYRPSGRNTVVADLYPTLGFQPTRAAADETRYEYLIGEHPRPQEYPIEVVSAR